MAALTPGLRTGGRPGESSGLTATIGRRVTARLAVWETPTTSYYLLLGSTLVLVVIGLVMVLSSSSVDALADGASPFAVFGKQALYAALGVPLMLGCSRVPVRVWKRLAWPLVALAVTAQLLVFTPLGFGVNGNVNWITLGPVSGQPSEAAKVALVVWCATILSTKAPLLHRWQHVIVPVGPVAAVIIALVLAGRDLGTALVIMMLVAVMLYVAGASGKLFALAVVAGGVLTGLLVLSSTNRVKRVQTWLGGAECDQMNDCWQSTHGTWALASGGWWGLGLGASREKWSWLPAAHNDFIYAIIGEELGLPGTLTILALFAVIAVAGLRVVLRHDDLFVKIATAGVLGWVVGQGLLNVAVVLGLLPVIGVPLPLVSSGGSALLTTLVALGMVLSFARTEPGARDALAARPGVVRRTLAVVGSRRGAGRERR